MAIWKSLMSKAAQHGARKAMEKAKEPETRAQAKQAAQRASDRPSRLWLGHFSSRRLRARFHGVVQLASFTQHTGRCHTAEHPSQARHVARRAVCLGLGWRRWITWT